MPDTLRVTPLGHSCVLVETGGARILLDPGNLTDPLAPITDLDAVLVTHAHADHLDPDQIARVAPGRSVPVYGDAAASALLTAAGLPAAREIPDGEFEIAGVAVRPSRLAHETIVEGLPLPGNTGFTIADRLFAPGDSFARPDGREVDVLLLPTGAPWMKLAEAIAYLQAVAPRIVIPVHDAGLARPHRELHRELMSKFAPPGTTVLRPSVGEPVDLVAAVR